MKKTLPFVCAAMMVSCAGDYHAQYESSVRSRDYAAARALMEQEIEALSVRDYSPTLPLRMGNAYYRLAYAHGMLRAYPEMKHALDAATSYDPGLTNHRQRMLEHVEVIEYNRAVEAYNGGRYEEACESLRQALSIVETEDPHKRCSGMMTRTLAIVIARSGDTRTALELCSQAQAMGDEEATRIKTALRENRTDVVPMVLQARDAVELRFL